MREIASVSMYTLPRSVAELLMNFLYYIKLLPSLLNAAGWLAALECVSSDGIGWEARENECAMGGQWGEMTKARYLRWKSSSERTFFIVSFFFFLQRFSLKYFLSSEKLSLSLTTKTWGNYIFWERSEKRRNWWRKSSISVLREVGNFLFVVRVELAKQNKFNSHRWCPSKRK